MAIRPQAAIDAESSADAFDAALAAKAAEEDYEDGQVALPELLDPEEEVEVVEGEPEPEPEPDKVDGASDLLERLVGVLESRPAPEAAKPEVPKRAELPQVDLVEMKKKFNEKLHETDDPSALIDEYAQAILGNTLAAQSREIQELKKDRLQTDPINKLVFDKWGDEVETVVANLPVAQQNHPDAYKYAVERVRNDHFTEILDAQVEERTVAKTRPGATTSLGQQQVAATTSATRKTKKVYASPRDKAEAKRHGIALKDYLKGIGKL